MNQQAPKPFFINDAEATFIYRALLSFKDKVTEVLESPSVISFELQASMIHMKYVAFYQHEVITGLMDELTEQFATDTKHLLPQ
jgi:5,10-methenyltetrahydromethanopterin hydrogenase